VYVLSSRPGRVAAEMAVPFGRGRERSLLRDQAFRELCWEIDDLLATPAEVAG
jgi:ABC-type nitrate/sulfonate/bicarbonate transport system ATPase subunit